MIMQWQRTFLAGVFVFAFFLSDFFAAAFFLSSFGAFFGFLATFPSGLSSSGGRQGAAVRNAAAPTTS